MESDNELTARLMERYDSGECLIAKHFQFIGLKGDRYTVARMLAELVIEVSGYNGAEASTCLRKLLEARDAAMRAMS
jgi:hypothetical protein